MFFLSLSLASSIPRVCLPIYFLVRFFSLEIQPLVDILRRIVGLQTFPVLTASVLFLPHQTADLYRMGFIFLFFSHYTSSAIAIGFERNWRKRRHLGFVPSFFPLSTRRPACKEAEEEEGKNSHLVLLSDAYRLFLFSFFFLFRFDFTPNLSAEVCVSSVQRRRHVHRPRENAAAGPTFPQQKKVQQLPITRDQFDDASIVYILNIRLNSYYSNQQRNMTIVLLTIRHLKSDCSSPIRLLQNNSCHL